MSRQSRCVFIGNIAYDATEDQLIEVFKEVGPVVNFRLVYDRDTRKPRGYGFCEYSDPDSAQSAMRNLNGREVNGRPLRVDFADNDRINMPGEGEYYGDRDFDKGRRRDGGGRGDARDRDFRDRDRGGRDRGDRDRGRDDRPADRRPADRGVASMMGQPIILPGGPPPPQNQPPMGRPMNAPGQQFPMEQQPPHAQGLPMDPITAALSQVPKNQLYDALAQMKGLTVTNPDLAKQIFHQIPTMALLMLHLEYIFGLVKQAPQPITLEGGMGAPAPPMMGAPPMAPPPMVAQPPPMPQGQPPMMGQPPPMHAMAPTQPTPIGMIPQGQPPMMGQPPPMRPPPVMPQGPPPMHGGMPQGPPPPMHPGGIPQGPPPPMHIAAAPPPPTPADQITQMLKSMTQQQIQDLLRLTPQQLEALNPTQRAQVQAIQSHMATLASSFLPKQM